ncbi:MAG: UvrD-helicase domain-containing protein [Thermoanaerobaculia bacterium]
MAVREKAPADRAARERIASRLEVNMLVEAAAGTGKTTSLVSRMVALVASGRYRVSELAAITFTRKAGAQLRERFQETLEAKAKESGDASLSAAVAELDRAFLGTTHAFCARLLRERPVEAGLEPDFRELDEQEAQLHASEFWTRWWESQVAADDPRVVRARRAGIRGWQLGEAFRPVVANPDVRLVWEECERPDLRPVCDALCGEIDRILPGLAPRQIDKEDEFGDMIRNVDRTRNGADLDDVRDQLRLLAEAKPKKAILNRWQPHQKALAKEIRDSWLTFFDSVITPAMRGWREYVHCVGMALLEPAAKAYAEERRREGIVTFDDLLLRARDLLRDHPDVRRYFASRYRMILVDEFQDTDPLQAEILFYLTGEDFEERDWRKVEPRPGSLFIVGDPKQSIYRFRRADITTYLDVRKRIVECGGEVVRLSTNFRSTPAICTFVNEKFSTLFNGPDVAEGRQAEHVALDPWREETLPGVQRMVTPGSGASKDNDGVAAAEAARVAAQVRRMVEERMPVFEPGGERPARWGDFLLVSRQRTRLRFYAEALEREGIAYEITGGKAFQESEELGALMPPLRAILEPDDAIPLVAFLRGPLCGVDDAALYRFKRSGGRFDWRSDLPEGTDPRIAAAVAMLKGAADDARSLPPAAVIARLVETLGMMPLAAARERGETRSGNLALALSYARHASAGGASLGEIVDLFESLLETSSEIEEMNIEPAAENAVRLMNLHQVKGLEAPFVFLIDPAPAWEFPVDLVVQRGEENRGHLALHWRDWRKAKWAQLRGQPQGWEELEEGEKGFVAAESRRLLYVAATRAKQWLTVGLRRYKHYGKFTEGGAWEDLGGETIPLLEEKERAGAAAAAAERVFDVEAARRALESARERSLTASYSVLPVTKVAHANQEALVRAEEGLGKGTSWGRVMHRLFEAMLRRPDLDVELFAKNLLKDEEREPAELDEVLRTVAAVRSSPLWRRVLAADEVRVEVPFAIEVPAAELRLSGPETTLLHGTVDLLFREGETWHVVDYKTDSTKDRLESLIEYYAPQVRHYASFWSRITGAPTRAGLFFVDGCREAWVEGLAARG